MPFLFDPPVAMTIQPELSNLDQTSLYQYIVSDVFVYFYYTTFQPHFVNQLETGRPLAVFRSVIALLPLRLRLPGMSHGCGGSANLWAIWLVTISSTLALSVG